MDIAGSSARVLRFEREPELMSRHRTTARGILLIFIVGLAVGVVAPSPAGVVPSTTAVTPSPAAVPAKKVPPLIFPVIGSATYTDDFGDARGNGGHQGNDLMAPKRAVAVAVEAGTVKFHTTSSRAGCMLYLYGRSGTTYLYIHLNNDLTRGNDNTGRCIAGVAYAKGLRSGAKVAAGQPIGFVGDSGDADGGSAHLHFELHPGDGAAVSPYPYLRKAKKLLFAIQPGKPFTAALRGKVVTSEPGSLTLDVERVQSWPGGLRVTNVRRHVELAVPPETVVTNPVGALIASARLAALKRGENAVAWTEKALATLEAALGEPFVLATKKVVLGSTVATSRPR